jgi:glucokinase
MTLTLGVDVGGTKILAALVDESGTIHQQVHRDTSSAATKNMVQAVEEIMSLPEAKGVKAAGIAAAAYISYPEGRVEFAPNVHFDDPDLRLAILRSFDLAVVVENDASAAAWGERLFGAGRGIDEMIMVAVGTGIGGGIVIGGELIRGARGFAGEFGHMTLLEGGPDCACGERGCLESLASGRAIEAMAKQKAVEGSAQALLEAAGGDVDNISGELVTVLASQGDEVSKGILGEAGRWLGIGLCSLINSFDPELVVVGGGVAEAGDLLLDPARSVVESRIAGRRSVPEIVPATLGNEAGAVGAAALAMSSYERRQAG